MKVLVTGAHGQLGEALLAIVPDGVHAVALSRAELDLEDGDAITRLIEEQRPDWLINTAAYTAVDKAESEPEKAHAINADAVATMRQALVQTGGRLFHVSTDFVFDGASDAPYDPDDVRNPLSVYGQSKSTGEDAAGSETTILRTSWVYAAGHQNFVTTMLRLMRSRGQIEVVNDQIGRPSWASDVALVIWRLLEKGQPGVFHHSDARCVSRYEFARAIAEEAFDLGLLDRIPEIVAVATADFPSPATRPLRCVLDDGSTRALLRDEAAPWRFNLRRMLQEEASLG